LIDGWMDVLSIDCFEMNDPMTHMSGWRHLW